MSDPLSYNGILGALYGLPAYRSKWMPDQMIVMAGNRSGKAMDMEYRPGDQTVRVGDRRYTLQALREMLNMPDRPYSKLTGSDLSRVLAGQLQSGGPIDDAERRKWMPVVSSASTVVTTGLTYTGNVAYGTTTSPYLSTTTGLWSDPLFTPQPVQNVETVFRVGADGRPEAVTRLVATPSKGAARNVGETELAWLKRRVDEISWVPA